MKYLAIIPLVYLGCHLLSWADKPLPPVKIQHSAVGFVAVPGYTDAAVWKAAYEVSDHAIKPRVR